MKSASDVSQSMFKQSLDSRAPLGNGMPVTSVMTPSFSATLTEVLRIVSRTASAIFRHLSGAASKLASSSRDTRSSTAARRIFTASAARSNGARTAEAIRAATDRGPFAPAPARFVLATANLLPDMACNKGRLPLPIPNLLIDYLMSKSYTQLAPFSYLHLKASSNIVSRPGRNLQLFDI